MADVPVPRQVRGYGAFLRVLEVAPAVLYLALIWLVSDLPGDSLPSNVDDRLAHFGEYALLMLLVTFALTAFDAERITARSLLLAGGFSFAWGLLDEIHQSWTPGRDASLKDVAFDLLGVLAAGAFIAVLAARDRRRA